ncbi:MAG TPA: murein biosynthesis integral membrane protein MurJ [Nocardioidaceae bacterium]|nr:murein biosynthesis integral membrane protein MurJ [Nocardioidaceae bacterium]
MSSRNGTTGDSTSDGTAESTSLLSSSAVMAAGTVVSRLSGFVRGTLLAASLGAYLHADLFNIANTIPNMLYILLAGGVFNAVLVPQLVRAMKNDADGGEAYTNRIITLAGLFLAGVTAVLVLAAPWLMRVFLSGDFFTPELAAQRESVIDFARYCLPQVFFYGMFVLVGQVLNARGRFGPMMWAPIANNVISVAVLVVYLFVFGPAGRNDTSAYGSGQEALLGLGSTLGIVLQLVVLVPYLKAAGFTFRPRFDFRGTGLGHTLRLGVWTVLFVVVNQIAYTVVVRLASNGAASGLGGEDPGTGYTIYSQTFLLVMVPHAIATVSLATAVLPRLSAHAAEHDLAGVARGVSSTLRTTLALIIPFALLLPLIAYDLSNVVFGWAAASEAFADYALPLSLFAIGLVFFTVHYLMLRGYYALERTRTVFWVQCVVAAANIVLAVALTRALTAQYTATALVLAYGGAYAVGATVSYLLLRQLLGGLETRVLARFLVRLLVAAGVATAVTWVLRQGVHQVWPPDDSKAQAVALLVACTGVDVVLFLVLAKVLRIREVTAVMELVTDRLPGRLGRRNA